MLSRRVPSACRALTSTTRPMTSLPSPQLARSFQTTTRRLDTPVVTQRPVVTQTALPPVRRPVGAFRGGIFGFLLGSTAAGAAVYYYILEEYRVSNELLTEDIYALQAAVQRIESYTRTLEERLVEMQKKK